MQSLEDIKKVYEDLLQSSDIKLPKPDIEELDTEYKNLIHEPAFREWRFNLDNGLGLYYGTKQFSEEDAKRLKKLQITPVACNIIAPTVNVLTGVEIQNEYRIKASIVNMTDEARDLEDALNQYFVVLQNKGEFATALRTALKDSIIGGLGFVRVWYDKHEPKVSYVNPYNVLLDFSDTTPDFAKQYTVITWEDLNPMEIRLRYGKKNFNKLGFSYKPDFLSSTSIMRSYAPSLISTTREYLRRVYTIRHRVVVNGYCGTLAGRTITTPIEIIGSQLENVHTEDMTINQNIVVCQGKILKTYIEEPVIVNSQLPIIPLVFQRDYNGVPQGLCNGLAQLQGAFNFSLSKSTAYANTENVYIFSHDPLIRQSLAEDASFVVKPNSVAVLAPTDRVERVQPTAAIHQQFELMQNALALVKKTSGIEDDSKGIPTNAVSGVAQQQRDIHSLRTNAFIYDNFKAFKKRIGTLILKQLEQGYETDIYVRTLDEEDRQPIILNQLVQRSDGTYQILRDISAQKWSISIEQAPIDSTTRSQLRLDLLSIAQTPFAPVIFRSKELLGLFVANPGKVMHEIQESMSQDQQKKAYTEEGQNNIGAKNGTTTGNY